MKRIVLCLMVCFLIVTVVVAYGAPDTVWVTSTGAKLKTDKRAGSETVATLPMGSKLEVIKLEGRWFQVVGPDGEKGWIYRGKVSRTAPKTSDKKGGGSQMGTLLGGLPGSKIGSDTPDTSRSIRALEPDKSSKNKKSAGKGDAQIALNRVLTFQVTEQEIEQFLETGRIGEYAP